MSPQRSHNTLASRRISHISWMRKSHTSNPLIQAFSKFFMSRGNILFQSFCLCPEVLDVATEVDSIGFVNITWGRLPLAMTRYQESSFRNSGSRRSSGVWARGLSHELIGLVHSQWSFRCNFVHDRGKDGLREKERSTLLQDMEAQFSLGRMGLDKDDQVSLGSLGQTSGKNQA